MYLFKIKYLHLYQHHCELNIQQYLNVHNRMLYVTLFFHLKHCLYPNPKTNSPHIYN